MSQASLDLARQLYHAVLGRDSDAADQANLAAFLDAGGNGGALLAGSAEAAAAIGTIYTQVLGRDVDASALSASQGYLAGGGTLAGLRTAAAHSREAALQINQFYWDGLGVNASADALTASENYLASGGTLGGLRAAVGGSAEASAAVTLLYETILGRAPDATGLANATAAISNGVTLTQLATAMVGSAEDGTKLSAAFQAAAGQAPDTTAVATMEDSVGRSAIPLALQLLARSSPASSVPPAPDLDGGGGSVFTLEENAPFPGTPWIGSVSPGQAEYLNVPQTGYPSDYRVPSANFTVSGGESGYPQSPLFYSTPGSAPAETISISAHLFGAALPTSPFTSATTDASGNWTVSTTHALPNGTYTLTPVGTITDGSILADGSTLTGTAATVIVAAASAYNPAASMTSAESSYSRGADTQRGAAAPVLTVENPSTTGVVPTLQGS